MKGLFLLLGLLLTFSGIVVGERPLKKKSYQKFDCLRGVLDHRVPISGGGSIAKPLKDVTLELYRWEAKESCCSESHPLWTVTTGRAGRYEFENVTLGRYWLVAHWSDRDYKIAISYDPEQDPGAECWQRGLEIDGKGNFVPWVQSTD